MALLQGTNMIFVRPIEGSFETSRKTGVDANGKNVYEKKRYFALTGKITNVEVKEEDAYEGGKENKVVVTVTDDSDAGNVETYSLKFRQESWFAQNFFSYIRGVDLSKMVKIGASGEKEPKSTVFCWMQQDGVKLEKNKSFPVRTVVKVGKTDVNDWSAVTDAMDGILAELKFGGAKPANSHSAVAAVEDEQEIPF